LTKQSQINELDYSYAIKTSIILNVAAHLALGFSSLLFEITTFYLSVFNIQQKVKRRILELS